MLDEKYRLVSTSESSLVEGGKICSWCGKPGAHISEYVDHPTHTGDLYYHEECYDKMRKYREQQAKD